VSKLTLKQRMKIVYFRQLRLYISSINKEGAKMIWLPTVHFASPIGGPHTVPTLKSYCRKGGKT